MKKHILLLASVALLGYSCNKEYDYDENIDKSPKTRLNISTNSLLSGFGNALNQSSDLNIVNSRNYLHTLVYDASGNLVASEKNALSSFFQEAGVTFDLPKGKYTIVNATINAYFDRATNEDFEYQNWTMSGEDKLSTLSFTASSYAMDYAYGILGYDKQEIEVTDKGYSDIIYVKSLSSLVRFRYVNFTAGRNADPDLKYIGIYVNKFNGYVSLAEDVKIETLPGLEGAEGVEGVTYFRRCNSVICSNYTNTTEVYASYSMLPDNYTFRVYDEREGDENLTLKGEYNVTFEQGKGYVIMYDLVTGSFSSTNIGSVKPEIEEEETENQDEASFSKINIDGKVYVVEK